MDNCKENIKAISLLIDGELDERQASELRAHIERCETCKKVYNAFSSISDSLGSELAEPPEMLAKGVMFKVNLIENGGKKRRFAFGRFTAIAACLALILIGAGHMGLLSGIKSDFVPSKASLSAESFLEDSAGADTEESFLDASPSLNFDFPNFGDEGLFEADSAPEAQKEEIGGIVTQFGHGGCVSFENNGLPIEDTGENDFLRFIATALNSSSRTVDSDLFCNGISVTDNAIYFVKDGERMPVEVRIYEGDAPDHAALSASNKALPEPLAVFTDIESLKDLAKLLETSAIPESEPSGKPSYTLAAYSLDGSPLDEDDLSPLVLLIHSGQVYLRGNDNAGLLLAECSEKDLLDFIDKLIEKASKP